MVIELTGRDKASIEDELGGPIEILFLSPDECLLVNAEARERHMGKNREASALYWEKNPLSGLGADFVLGPALHVSTKDIEGLELLDAVCPKTLTLEERQQNMLLRKKVYTAEESLQCSLDNPDACEACGS